MGWFAILMIAVGLAMDAFAVSVSSGIAINKMRVRHALLIATFFGVFQAMMPCLGWHVGGIAKSFVAPVDHWVAFGLLAAIGIKMIYEAFQDGDGEEEAADPLNLHVLFVLAIATSIDALIVGVTLSLQDVAILTPILVIGSVTFAMSWGGTYLGNRMGHHFDEKKLEIAGGVILIGIGLKILLQHTLWHAG